MSVWGRAPPPVQAEQRSAETADVVFTEPTGQRAVRPFDFAQGRLSTPLRSGRDDKILQGGTGPDLTPKISRQLHQTPHRNSRRPFRHPRLLILRPRRTGDIEMNPRSILGEFLEKHRRGNGPAPASAGINNVGDIGANAFFVLFVERQAPEFLAGFFQRLAEALI